MRRRRERGSICLYVAVVLLSMGLIFAAVVPLGTAMQARSTREADALKARLAFEAGVSMIKAQSLAMTISLGTPTAVSVSGVSGTVTPTLYSSSSLLVSGAMTRNGRTYRYGRVIGLRMPGPLSFVIASKANLNLKTVVSGSGGVDGDWYGEGNVNVTGSNAVVNGNILAGNSINTRADTTVTGQSFSNAPTFTWPTLTDANYQAEAASLMSLSAGFINLLSANSTGITFTSPSNGKYPIYYYGSNLTLKGTLTGKGTIYVKGNLTVSGDLAYSSSTDRVAIVVKGNATVSGVATHLSGYLFVGGTFSTSGNLTLDRGAIVANSFSSNDNLTLTRDNAVLADTNEGTLLRFPYYWP